jgi:hypothetical protein
MLADMENMGELALLPVGQLRPGDGVALTSEVVTVVEKRRGAVLAAQTILKYDHFPGCQKLSLSERIDGAPNFRQVDVNTVVSQSPHRVYGVAMPTRDAIRLVLDRTQAGPGGTKALLWTSLREEPVLYVNGKPYVLRLSQDPIKNLETTGITMDRVEMMEQRMKQDVLEGLFSYTLFD